MIPGQRVEYRPALRENLWWLALFNGLAAFMGVGTVIWRVYTNNPLETLGIAIFVLYFGVWPWAYLRAAVLWIDDTHVGVVDRLFRRREAPRAAITRVVGVMGWILFLGADDRILLKVGSFLNNGQVKAVAADLGLKAEGVGRWLIPL